MGRRSMNKPSDPIKKPSKGEKDGFIKVNVTGLTIDPFTNMPIIILKDENQKNALPIWIGLIEASAIATELEKIELSRPMTHDLLKNILTELQITVVRVEISDLQDNTFFASIHLNKEGKNMIVDSRPSDAVALALRTDAPIFVSKHVMEKSRKIDLTSESPDGEESAKKEKWTEILENLSPEDFGKYKM
jgi:bifunctional DNase/RNase